MGTLFSSLLSSLPSSSIGSVQFSYIDKQLALFGNYKQHIDKINKSGSTIHTSGYAVNEIWDKTLSNNICHKISDNTYNVKVNATASKEEALKGGLADHVYFTLL